MLRIALIVLSNEVKPIILAAETIRKKTGFSIEIYHRTAESLANSDSLNEFLKLAQRSHVMLMHTIGGAKGFPEFDRVASALSDKLVPVFASDVQSDPEIVLSSTVDIKDYRTIYEYIKSGGVENYENLLRFLANHFADGNFEVDPPKQMSIA